jgi:hypothetical protein
MGRPTRCHHVCQCGAVLICGDPDRCVVGRTEWQCPTCEQDIADAYWQQQQAMTAEPPTTETQETR